MMIIQVRVRPYDRMPEESFARKSLLYGRDYGILTEVRFSFRPVSVVIFKTSDNVYFTSQ